jgi:hypothetical protein
LINTFYCLNVIDAGIPVNNILLFNISLRFDFSAIIFLFFINFITYLLLLNQLNNINFLLCSFIKIFSIGAFAANSLITVAVFMETSALVIFI